MKEPLVMPIFPTVIMIGEIEREFTQKELDFVKLHSTQLVINEGNKTSKNNYILNENEMKDLKLVFINYLEYYLKEIYQAKDEIKIYITQSWLNYSNKNEFHHQHFHSNSILSCVFYFETNNDDEIILLDEKRPILSFEAKQYNLLNAKTWSIPAKKGQLIIFPSNIEHSVPKVKGNKTRISLSFNSFIKGNLGKSEYLSELNL
jgi:uncharacterized protein (TIGR02466 family)